MTLEEWIEDKLDRAQRDAAESSKFPNSYGAGYDRGYADALQVIFVGLPASIAHAKMQPEAADEIERLNREVQRLEEAIAMWRKHAYELAIPSDGQQT